MNLLVLSADDTYRTQLQGIFSRMVPTAQIRSYASTDIALTRILEQAFFPHVAMIDTDTLGRDGVNAARWLKGVSPTVNLILADHEIRYAAEAIPLRISGYCKTPVTEEQLRFEMDHLRYAEAQAVQSLPTTRYCARCFGSFHFTVDGEALAFKRTKARQLLAYLIHKRGTPCTTRQLALTLFAHRSDSDTIVGQTRVLIAALLHTLAEANAAELVRREGSTIAVNPSLIDCDYYRFLKGDPDSIRAYMGEYMAGYNWGSVTQDYLDQKCERYNTRNEWAQSR